MAVCALVCACVCVCARVCVCVCVSVCETRVRWVVSTHYHYTTQTLIGILRRKLILPSAVALACVPPCVNVFVYFWVENFHFKWGICWLNFGIAQSDAAWRHSNRLGCPLAVNSAGTFSIQVEAKGKPWPYFNLNISFKPFSLLLSLGWMKDHQWKCCSWLTRNETILFPACTGQSEKSHSVIAAP